MVGDNPDAAAGDSDDHEGMFETILLAIDGSSRADALLAYAQRLAGHYGSGVLVVCVGATSSVSQSIRRQVTQLRSDGVPARLAVVADGRDTASVIVHLAEAWNADRCWSDLGAPVPAEVSPSGCSRAHRVRCLPSRTPAAPV